MKLWPILACHLGLLSSFGLPILGLQQNTTSCYLFTNSTIEKTAEGSENGDEYRLFSTKTTYLTAREEIRKIFDPRWPQELINQCTPIYLFFLSRHSIRYPSAKEIKNLREMLHSLRQELIQSHQLKGRMFMHLASWQFKMVESDDNHVSDSGKAETAKQAEFFYKYFPTLLDINKANFEVGISQKIRTEETADAWIDSLIEKQLPTDSDSSLKESIKQSKFVKIKNDLLMSHRKCKKLIKESSIESEKEMDSSEYDGLLKSGPILQMVETFSHRIGLNYTLSVDSLILIYKACSYETALFGSSPWCDLFVLPELKTIEYLLDIFEYNDAYEIKPHREMACVVMEDLKTKLKSIIDQDRNSPGLINATLYFSHENLLSKVMSYFGLFKGFPKIDHNEDTEDGKRFCIPEKRWRSSLVVPFGTNFVAALHKCPDSEASNGNAKYRVLTLVNEIPVVVRGCDSSFCDTEKFLKSHQHDPVTCDLERICKI